jgi:tripartite-type tricarboxylate transporter receptor subunit TctC
MATRRSLLTSIVGAGSALALPTIARAQDKYPNKPIKLIVPFPPGGPTDTIARVIAQDLSNRIGQVVVENRPGAGSTMATKDVAAADPDGYTLLLGTSGSLAVAPALYSSMKLDPQKAFAPIATIALLPHVFVVNNEVPAKSIAEFIAFAEVNPGKINFGAGLGTPPHLLCVLFKTETKLDMVYVPYTGAAQSVNDLLGNRTQFTIDGLVTLYPLIQAGKLRALAVGRRERWPALPDVPTLVESGYPDFVLDAWTSLVAPAGTPPEIINKLNAAVNEGLQTKAMKESLDKFSAIAKVGSPEDFRKFLADQTQRWAALVKLADAHVD